MKKIILLVVFFITSFGVVKSQETFVFNRYYLFGTNYVGKSVLSFEQDFSIATLDMSGDKIRMNCYYGDVVVRDGFKYVALYCRSYAEEDMLILLRDDKKAAGITRIDDGLSIVLYVE